eukprot:1051708-Prorocentrum_minimum.AAC.2
MAIKPGFPAQRKSGQKCQDFKTKTEIFTKRVRDDMLTWSLQNVRRLESGEATISQGLVLPRAEHPRSENAW